MDPFAQAAQQNQTPQPTPEDALAATNQAVQKKKGALQQFETQLPDQNQAAITQAMAQLSSGKPQQPMEKVGDALNTNNYSGLCLAYVDDQTGNKNRQPTAYADYEQNEANGNIKTSGTPPKGARIYFAPTQDNPAGHVGLSNGDGSFTGATTNQGIKTFNIKDWETYAGQQYIGWAPPGSS